jgi:hypothetical protein
MRGDFRGATGRLVHGHVNLAPEPELDVFCQFEYEHHSMLVDLCDEPLIRD